MPNQRVSPTKPSKEEIETYADFVDLKKITAPRFLVLGSTPELRNLALSYPESLVAVADIDIEMLVSQAKLVEKDTSKEIWIKSDWLNAPIKEDFFDVILGDFTFENLDFEKHKIYFENIKKWLKKDGEYIGRIALFQERHKQLLVEDINQLCNGKEIDSKLLSLFWTIGPMFTSEIKTKEVKLSDFLNKVNQYKESLGKDYDNTAIKSIMEHYIENDLADVSWFIWEKNDFKELMTSLGMSIISEKSSTDINLPDNFKDFVAVYSIRPL